MNVGLHEKIVEHIIEKKGEKVEVVLGIVQMNVQESVILIENPLIHLRILIEGLRRAIVIPDGIVRDHKVTDHLDLRHVSHVNDTDQSLRDEVTLIIGQKTKDHHDHHIVRIVIAQVHGNIGNIPNHRRENQMIER